MRISEPHLENAWQVKAIIEKDYHKQTTVADLAQMVGTNKCSLNLAFKAITGLSVKKYINEFRIEKARQLLETSNTAVEIIAGRVGLHRTNLEKNFKKCFGKSPKEWRKNHNSLNPMQDTHERV